jgi:hypothetical protein
MKRGVTIRHGGARVPAGFPPKGRILRPGDAIRHGDRGVLLPFRPLHGGRNGLPGPVKPAVVKVGLVRHGGGVPCVACLPEVPNLEAKP